MQICYWVCCVNIMNYNLWQKRRDAIDLGLNTTIGYQPTVKLAILSWPFHN